MTVTVYRSTDAGAPTLSGVQGTMISVLRACLVDGYGSKPAAGWSMPFTATNKAAFKQPATSNGFWLSVDETTTDNYARWFGYENMTSISSGIGQFPHTSMQQVATYRTTHGANSPTALYWMIVATDKIFYFWYSATSTMPSSSCFMTVFGDFVSNMPGDKYNTILIGHNVSSGGAMQIMTTSVLDGDGQTGHYVPRNHLQTGGCIRVNKTSDYAKIGSTTMGASGMMFPNPSDGKIYVAPINISETVGLMVGVIRGYLPGVYAPCFKVSGVTNDGDQFPDVTGLVGKTLEMKHLSGGGSPPSGVLLEISNTW